MLTWKLNTSLIIPPKKIANVKAKYFGNYNTYSDYNYFGPMAFLKRRHMEIALKISKDYFHKANVIDFGCADGFLLPSLSNYFNHVVGIDTNSQSIACAKVISSELDNVQIFCNDGISNKEIMDQLGMKYDIIFCLEVLEHVGRNWRTMYQDKLELLDELFAFLHDDGFIIASVPKMVGPSFLAQRIGLSILGMHQHEASPIEILKATLGDTSSFEPRWLPYFTHIGFNHWKLEEMLYSSYSITRINDLFQVIYKIERM